MFPIITSDKQKAFEENCKENNITERIGRNMIIEHVNYNGKEHINVLADKSTQKGILRFGHEIQVTFLLKDTELIFQNAWHCGVSEMSWDATEESLFEETFPGLLTEMREAIKKDKK